MTYTESFPINFDPLANPRATYVMGKARFTMLTSRLVRLEFSPTGEFENRPSQAFWYRNHPAPDFEVIKDNHSLTITTPHLELSYTTNELGFSDNTLSITLKENGKVWHFGDIDSFNLGGTSRTLDDIDGALVLEEGLLSRSGYAVYDDSARLIFNTEGWLEPRNTPDGTKDLYFFGYGQDAEACLRDFARTTGPAPMIPRWALGNWWSRYWTYSADDLLALMDEFESHNIPLSVCIVDMDWHITATGNQSSGWTGYTWNRELFPDPQGFIAELHRRGLKTALNLHPAEGVHPHEEQYPEFASGMGLDPAKGEPVNFDIANPKFTRLYFEKLHHPHEADGVDFWWTDWQQGTLSGLPGLDPLWWLNHLHFHDLGRDHMKRPFIFSRWGGLGNHRYPIGFSGDTHVTWESLAFQPFFTATAANVNYGWWSHDIGGHMGGIENSELFTRWVQFGVFSPIFRLHCTNNPFHERRPWGWDAETERIISDAMRLRHRLIPYLYTMAWRNHTQHLPLMRPMYHAYPDQEPAYHCPNQYLFGSELLAAPFINPMDTNLQLSKQVVWLPPGEWTHFFDGTHYFGDAWYPIYGALDEIPIFAKQGAIVPLAAADGLGNPEEIEVHFFPGADNEFQLFEDDGLTEHSLTTIEQLWTPKKWAASIKAVEGATEHLPTSRKWTLNFRNTAEDTGILTDVEIKSEYDQNKKTLSITTAPLPVSSSFTITLTHNDNNLLTSDDHLLKTCQKLVAAFRMESWTKQALFYQLPDLIKDPASLLIAELILISTQIKALTEVILGAGFHEFQSPNSQARIILLWNNTRTASVQLRFSAFDLNWKPFTIRKSMPKFGKIVIGDSTLSFLEDGQPNLYNSNQWQVFIDYLDILRESLK